LIRFSSLIIVEDYSGREVNIFGSDSMGHCKKKRRSYEYLSNSEWLQ